MVHIGSRGFMASDRRFVDETLIGHAAAKRFSDSYEKVQQYFARESKAIGISKDPVRIRFVRFVCHVTGFAVIAQRMRKSTNVDEGVQEFFS